MNARPEPKTRSGRWKRANREAARRYNAQDIAKRGPSRWYTTCPKCGGAMAFGVVQCQVCRAGDVARAKAQLLEERAVVIVRMWAAGADRNEIAAALGISPSFVSKLIAGLRTRGYDLPYRRADSVERARRLGHRERAA